MAVLSYSPTQKIKLDDSDLEVQWYSGTGAGGQFRNKVMTSCRLIHRPTGLVTTVSTRSRVNSLDEARSAMLERLQASTTQSSHASLSRIRKEQVGSGMRGDKIRTVQFQNDTTTDHRNNRRCTAQDYLKGHMDRLWT